MTQPLTVSVKQAAAMTSLCSKTLYRHMRAGRLQSVKLNGRRLIPMAALEALVGAESRDDRRDGNRQHTKELAKSIR